MVVMTNVSRKFKARSMLSKKTQRAESPHSQRSVHRGGRRTRRPRAKKGLDPSVLTLFVLLPFMILSSLLGLYFKTRTESRVVQEEISEMVEKDEHLAPVIEKTGIPRNLSRDQGEQLKTLFQLMSDFTKKNKPGLDQAREDLVERIQTYDQVELLNAELLKDSREIYRQKKVVLGVRMTARRGINLMKKAIGDFKASIESADLGDEAKRGALKGQRRLQSDFEKNPLHLFLKRSDIELKILALFEKHGGQMTVLERGTVEFADANVQRSYERLMANRDGLNGKIAKTEFASGTE